ncbi:MAG: restriction endonuclease PLD domain-containing protein, partial [Bacteroidota bacterium]
HILEELKSVSFQKPHGADTFDFYGHPQNASPFPKTCNRSLIISPFIRAEQLKKIPVGNEAAHLISRQEELDKISTENLKAYKCYVLKDTVIDGETIIDENLVHRKQNNIHGKVYVWENEAQKKQTNVFLGSANCSNAAFSQNIEAMVHLKYSHSIWEDILHPLIGCEDYYDTALCSPYIPREAEEVDPEVESIKKIKRSITLVMDTVIINRGNDYTYKMTIPIKDEVSMTSGISATIAPLTQKDLLRDLKGKEIVFENLSIEHLTTFIIVTINSTKVKSESFVMRLKPEIDEDIMAAREQLLMRQLFTSMKKLLSYIAYLLDVETFDSPEFSSASIGSNNGASGNSLHYEILPLYEKLLVMAANNPIQLKKIDIALATLKESSELDGDEFQELITFWEPFRNFIPDTKT